MPTQCAFLERTQAHDADPMKRSDEEYEKEALALTSINGKYIHIYRNKWKKGDKNKETLNNFFIEEGR